MKTIRAVLLLAFCSFSFSQEPPLSDVSVIVGTQENEWVLCHTCDFPVWVALNSSPGFAPVPQRKIYLFIQPADFTQGNLRKVFTKFAQENPDPKILSITAFSDRQMFKQLISIERSGYIDFWDTPEGREAAKKYHESLNLSLKGFFRAYYYRSNFGEEGFKYNPNPDVEAFTYIKLKERPEETYTGESNPDLILAAKKGDILKLKELLDKGADINSKDSQGSTPLIQAKDTETVKILIERGAKVDDRDKYGVTALIRAADSERNDIVQVLLNHGASINLKDKYGYTALIVAAMNGYSSVVDILLKSGADATVTNELGKTAMMLAREKGHGEVVLRLEAAGIQK